MTEVALAEQVQLAIEAFPAAARPASLRVNVFKYIDLLIQANKSINLVSRRDTQHHIASFVGECLLLARRLWEGGAQTSSRFVDIGTGAGFPGLLVKLALPHLEVTLIEGTGKKAEFLASVCESLDLAGVTVLWARAEDVATPKSAAFRPELRHACAWVTAKGLGSLLYTSRLAVPFLAVGGSHWAFKGRSVNAELRDCRRFFSQARLEQCHLERLPETDASHLVGIRRLPPA